MQGFVDLRLILTANIDNIITTIARTTLEEFEKCINIGDVETGWLPWAKRLKQSSAYMRTMECAVNVDADTMNINSSFEILSHVERISHTFLRNRVQTMN